MMTAIGLMSGTSMDGIDIALIRTDGQDRIEFGPNGGFAYDPAFRSLLKDALEIAKVMTKRGQRPGDLAAIETALTDRHIKAVEDFLALHNLSPKDIDLVGFHGQTVLHRPLEGLTVQIGDGGKLSRETGIDVVYDLRANDMVHGGQGAPLVPVFHAALARGIPQAAGQSVVFVNIGGISNITHVGKDGEVIACDAGPGNTLIDQWVEQAAGIPFDQGGAIASEGGILDDLVRRYMAAPFFHAPDRISLDRNDFRPPSAEEAGLHDGARTLAHVTAKAIVRTIERHLPDRPSLIIVCGGGRHNRVIMEDLADLAADWSGRVQPAEDFGLNGDSMEAEAWAYLAVRSKLGLPITFPGTTGVSEPQTGGVLARHEVLSA